MSVDEQESLTIILYLRILCEYHIFKMFNFLIDMTAKIIGK